MIKKEISIFSKYMHETIAGGFQNQLPISSVCNADCIFCSNNMNPFPIHRIGFRDIDDIKKGIVLLNSNTPEIRIGDSLPGRISEGEALLHPEILLILRLIREKAPKSVIQLNTNGTTLTPDFINSLKEFKPMKFTISYHSDVQENWCRVFNLNAEKYKIARSCFDLLVRNDFTVESAIVPLPNLFGYSDIEKTISNFRFYTTSILAYLPGYSKYADNKLQGILDFDPVEMSQFLSKMRKKYKINIHETHDILKPLNFTPFNLMIKSYNSKFKNVLWMLSSAAFIRANKVIKSHLPYVPNNHHTVKVKNFTYGGNIDSAGLLMVKDFNRCIKKTLNKYAKANIKIDLIILPKIPFDRFGEDLTGENFSKLKDEYNIPIWLG